MDIHTEDMNIETKNSHYEMNYKYDTETKRYFICSLEVVQLKSAKVHLSYNSITT